MRGWGLESHLQRDVASVLEGDVPGRCQSTAAREGEGLEGAGHVQSGHTHHGSDGNGCYGNGT